MESKELYFLKKASDERIEEKKATLQNNSLLIYYMKKNKLDCFCGSTIEELEEKNKKLIDYIKIASK